MVTTLLESTIEQLDLCGPIGFHAFPFVGGFKELFS